MIWIIIGPYHIIADNLIGVIKKTFREYFQLIYFKSKKNIHLKNKISLKVMFFYTVLLGIVHTQN